MTRIIDQDGREITGVADVELSPLPEQVEDMPKLSEPVQVDLSTAAHMMEESMGSDWLYGLGACLHEAARIMRRMTETALCWGEEHPRWAHLITHAKKKRTRKKYTERCVREVAARMKEEA